MHVMVHFPQNERIEKNGSDRKEDEKHNAADGATNGCDISILQHEHLKYLPRDLIETMQLPLAKPPSHSSSLLLLQQLLLGSVCSTPAHHMNGNRGNKHTAVRSTYSNEDRAAVLHTLDAHLE